MPWQGSQGSQSFSRTDGTRSGSTVWQDAEAADVDIVSDDHDTHDQDLSDGVNACLKKDGGNTATGNIRLGGFKIINLGTGTADTDAVNKAQMDAAVAGAGDGFPSTTRLAFQQSSAPTGWTKITSSDYHNTALRIVTGSVSNKFSGSSFTSVFKAVSVSQANLPNVNLSASNLTITGSPSLSGSQSGGLARNLSTGTGGYDTGGTQAIQNVSFSDTTLSVGIGTLAVGGHVKLGGSGTPLDFNVNYIDFIVAEKD